MPLTGAFFFIHYLVTFFWEPTFCILSDASLSSVEPNLFVSTLKLLFVLQCLILHIFVLAEAMFSTSFFYSIFHKMEKSLILLLDILFCSKAQLTLGFCLYLWISGFLSFRFSFICCDTFLKWIFQVQLLWYTSKTRSVYICRVKPLFILFILIICGEIKHIMIGISYWTQWNKLPL